MDNVMNECRLNNIEDRFEDLLLRLSLRPKKLEDIIGLDDTVSDIKNQFKSKRIPHFFLISGESGTGKTTLARIIAMMLQNSKPGESTEKYDIKELNAADKNGIDDVRDLIEKAKYRPIKPSIAKIVIYDEAHQLTTPAQNALLKITEDAYNYLYFIFCTTNETKIITALKRRAHIIHTHGIDRESTNKLLQLAKNSIKSDKDIKELEDVLAEHSIDSPGLILQAAEKYFNGSTAKECILMETSGEIESKKLCLLLSKGDWKSVAPILKLMKKEDVVMMRAFILGYFKAILLSVGQDKATVLAKAMKLVDNKYEDLPIFCANLCLVCDILKK